MCGHNYGNLTDNQRYTTSRSISLNIFQQSVQINARFERQLYCNRLFLFIM